MNVKLFMIDFNLVKMVEFYGVYWLNFNLLVCLLWLELVFGEYFEVELVKVGKEEG